MFDNDDNIIESELLITDGFGIYIPQNFAERITAKEWDISAEDESILLQGPDHEHYWEVWDDVLSNARFVDHAGNTWHLYQDGDLYAVRYVD